MNAQSDPAQQKQWFVFRQDDNGNVFEVERGLSEEEARRLAAELESHGHKQLYWVTQTNPLAPIQNARK